MSLLRRGPVRIVLAGLAALLLVEVGFGAAAAITESRFDATLPDRLEDGINDVRRLFREREAAAIGLAGRVAARVADSDRLPDPGDYETIELFDDLAAERRPPGISGLMIRGADGRPLAWQGRTWGVPAEPPGRSRTGITGGTVYRALFVEVPVRRGDRIVGGVTAWWPFDLNYPLHNRYLRGGDFEEEVAKRFGLKRIDVRAGPPPEDLPELARTGPLPGLDGDPIAHITVEVFPAVVHGARIRHTGRGARAALVALLLAALAAFTGRAALRGPRPFGALAAFAALVFVGRWLLNEAGFPRLVFGGPAFDPAWFSHPSSLFGIPLGLFHSPADLAITGVLAIALSAVATVTAARHLVARLPRGFLVKWALLCLALLVSEIAVLAWTKLIHLLPYSSTVEFFSELTVLPELPATLLLLGLFLLTVALFLPVVALAALGARLLEADRDGFRWVLAGLWGAALGFTALNVSTELSGELIAVSSVALGLGAALAAAGRAVSPGLRLAGAAVLATIFVYAPFQREVWREIRADVEEQAEELFTPSRTNPLAHRLEADLAELASSPRLRRALAEGGDRERPQLAFRLWAESPFARRPRGADIEILDRTRTRVVSRFDIDMPPRAWLPDVLPGGAADQPTLDVRSGVGGGLEQEFLVGSAPVLSFDGDFLGQVIVRVPVERPVLGPSSRPEILSSYGDTPISANVRDLHYSVYDGVQLASTTNPEYPRLRRVPENVVAELRSGDRPSAWTREEVAGTYWISLYRPRIADGEVVGYMSVSFQSRERSDLFLAFFKLLLVNLLVVFLAGLLLALPALPRFVWKFQHKLLFSYLVISALPVFLLAELNRGLARETVEQQMRDTLRESVRLVRGELRDRGIIGEIDFFVTPEASRETVRAVVDDELLKEIGYRLGQEVNLFLRGVGGEWGAPLIASSEPGIFATELFSDRVGGDAYREVVLLGREFHTARESVGDYSFLVGYTPLPNRQGEPMGAISLPMIYGQDAVDRELASRNSLIVALYLLVLLVVFFIGAVLARRIASPIERLVEGTRRLSAGDLSYRIPRVSKDEFGYLVDSFNRMTGDIEESRERVVKAEKDAAWREMAKQIAHEIKNPLTPMRLSAQHILRAWGDRHEDFEEILGRGVDTIIRQTETLRRIAGEFSSFARLPQKRSVRVDPGAVAREVAALYVGTEDVEIVEEIEPVPAVLVDGDELKRVLVNLATNAVQAMEASGGRLVIGVRLVTTRFDGAKRELVELSVSDTGVGIRPEDLGKLFQPNFSTKTGGTGLGLAISKAVVESFGGDITVESAPGAGTTVRVLLPPVDGGEEPE